MTDFLAGTGELLRKIVHVDGACLIFKAKSCFFDEWRRETDYLEIGVSCPRSSSCLCRGCSSRYSRSEFGIKKTASLRPRISVPGFGEKPKNRSHPPPNENQCPVKSSVLHGACHFCLISLKTRDLWLSLLTFSRPPREREIPPKTPVSLKSSVCFSLRPRIRVLGLKSALVP